MRTVKRLAVVVLLATLTACGTGGTGFGTGPSGSPIRVGDAGAELACTHFRNVVADVADGLLTDEELRQKLKEVYSSAQGSSEPGILDGAKAMLSDMTAGDSAALGNDLRAFSDACTAAGF